jgi:hypothetical protein
MAKTPPELKKQYFYETLAGSSAYSITQHSNQYSDSAISLAVEALGN